MKLRNLFLSLLFWLPLAALAEDFDYRLSPYAVAEDTYVFIGKTEDFNRENGGNIVNTAFIVTRDGVVVIDTGSTRRYGEQMRQAIAKVTRQPVIKVFNTHHHPDHFLGNQAFKDVPILALPTTIAGEQAEGDAFANNVYRMSGDWAQGTEPFPAKQAVHPGHMSIGGHDLEIIGWGGHTAADMVIFDHTTGVLFAADLVFYNRAATTPHAVLADWFASLDRIQKIPFKVLVPGHGLPVMDSRAIEQTRNYLHWLDRTLRNAARNGTEMAELLARPIPAEFSGIALVASEYARSIAHLYRHYEAETLAPAGH
jgi:uncharacterized sulfatase